jgi:quercetin dioxygenase-like cupin family protein
MTRSPSPASAEQTALKGKVGFRFGDREEIYEAGDAFYVPPGHTPFGYAGSEMVMFQPSEEMAKTVETMKRNMEAATADHAH